MEPSRGRDGTLDISRPFHGPKNVVCAPRSSPGKQPTTGSKFTPAANPTHLPPPGTQRLKHLKRHLLTRKCLHLLVRTPKLINHICPDTDSKKCECKVSRSSWYQTLPPVLNGPTRDVISSLPGEIFSRSTCEYAANRTSNHFPTPISAHITGTQTAKSDHPSPGGNRERPVLWQNASVIYNSLAYVVSPRKRNTPMGSPLFFRLPSKPPELPT